jgi:hypothetical protein
MADQCGDEEGRYVQQHHQRQIVVHGKDDGRHQRDQERRLDQDRAVVRQQRCALEYDYEAQEIQCQRDDPEERRRRDVGRQVRGDRDQQRGGDGCKEGPDRGVAPAWSRTGGSRGGRSCGARAPRHDAASPDQRDQRIERDRPDPRLLAEPGHRLDDERIAEERENASGVAGGIEKIGVAGARMAAAREPGLQQRRIRRQREKRKADGGREQPDEPDRLALGGRAFPPGGNGEWQRERRHDHDRDVDRHRGLGGGVADESMGIGVAGEQRGLKEDDGDRPHRRRAAELRQHHLGEHRLYCEQQRGTQEDGGDEGGEQGARGRAGRDGGWGLDGHVWSRGGQSDWSLDFRRRPEAARG